MTIKQWKKRSLTTRTDHHAAPLLLAYKWQFWSHFLVAREFIHPGVFTNQNYRIFDVIGSHQSKIDMWKFSKITVYFFKPIKNWLLKVTQLFKFFHQSKWQFINQSVTVICLSRMGLTGYAYAVPYMQNALAYFVCSLLHSKSSY